MSLVLTTKFVGVFILVSALGRRRGNGMNPVELRYPEILGLSPEVFLNPSGARHYPKKRE